MTTSKETWIELFGHEPNKAMKEMVLQEVADSGKDIREVISRYVLPEMAIIGSDGKFDYQNKRITVDEYRAIAPLGPYAKLVIVKL